MIGSALGETVNLIVGPGLVFLLVSVWLIRRVIRAARTESQLEEQRLREWMKSEVSQLQSSKAEPRLVRVPPAAEREKALAAARQAVASPPSPEAVTLVDPPPPLEAPPPLETAPPLEAPPPQGPPVVFPEDKSDVTDAELDVIRPLLGADGGGGTQPQPRLLWIRSTGSHIAFCERREPTPPSTLVRDVITVVKIAGGKVVGKWQFG
jgi:hypothetical protein